MNKLGGIQQINLSSSVLDLLDYNDILHVYLYNGEIIPGVTQLVEMVLGNDYKGVPEKILRQASMKGTRMHECIETFEEKGIILDSDYMQEVTSYIELMREYELKPLVSEGQVLYIDKDIKYAGRFDMLAENMDKELVLIDFKRTSNINKKRVFLQLNMYAEAFEYTYRGKIKKLYCMHLREHKKKMVEIVRNNEMLGMVKSCLEVLRK